MLLKYENVQLPKLAVEKTSTTKTTRTRTPVDDSFEVSKKMKELFSCYNWKTVTTEEELIDYLSTRQELGLDTETTGLDVFKDKLVGFSVGTVDDCIYIPLAHKVGQNYTGDLSKLQSILDARGIYGFNAKFDIKFLRKQANLNVRVKWCGYLAARLMNSSEPSNELKELYIKYVDPNAKFYSFRDLFKRPFDQYDPAIVGAYAAVDAMKHIALGKWQEEHIGKAERKLMTNLELPLAHQLVDIELTGVQLDVDWCKELSNQLEQDLKKAEEDIARDYEGLNPGSPKQVAEWLYDKLKLPQIQGRGTGEGILKLFDHPLPRKILEYRKAQKLLGTYAQKMPLIADNGVVHCIFNQYGADTGRFSSSNPNLQNIPKDNRFRKMFRARDGMTLVSCDYSQQEVRILAALAGDESMKEAYEKDMDFYAYMASLVFDKPYELCQKHAEFGELRNQMKSIVLGLNYDMGLRSLANDIHKSVEETKAIYAKFFEKCPRIKSYKQEKAEFARKNGYVETVLGRKRFFKSLNKPDFECKNKDVQDTLNKLKNEWSINKLLADAKNEGIEVIDWRKQKIVESRQVVNSIIQGSASDMTKLAIVEFGKNQRLKELGAHILLQIHDELIIEAPDENAKEAGDILAKLMTDVGTDLVGLWMKCEPDLMKFWQKD